MKGIPNHLFFSKDHKPGHQKSLDGLRGVAVLLVLLAHASNNDFSFFDGLTFYGIGKGGVYLFFVLSAYLLDQQIIRAMANGTANSFFWRRYFIRRVLRIFPLLILALITFYLIFRFGVITPIRSMNDIVRHFFLLDGKSIFWSVPVEFKYYVLSPLIIWVCQKFLKWDIKKITLLLCILIIVTLSYDTFLEFSKLNTLKYLPVFLAGTFIALYTSQKRYPNVSASRIAIFGFMSLLLCLLTNPTYANDFLGISIVNNGRQIMLVYTLLCFVMLTAAISPKNIFRSFLEMKCLRFIGVISFSAYLFHMPVILILKSGSWRIPDDIRIYIYFILTFIISTLLYVCVEKPLSRITLWKPSMPSGPDTPP